MCNLRTRNHFGKIDGRKLIKPSINYKGIIIFGPSSSLYKKRDFEFSKFFQKGKIQIFSMKREGLVKYGGSLKKRGTLSLFILNNPFQS